MCIVALGSATLTLTPSRWSVRAPRVIRSRQLHTRAHESVLHGVLSRAFGCSGWNSSRALLCAHGCCRSRIDKSGEDMPEIQTIRKRTELCRCGLGVASMLLALAALTSCDEQPLPSANTTTKVVDDSAAAYAALSNALERCEDAHEACLQTAGDDTSARDSCARDASRCRAQAEPMAKQAESTLERETRRCHKICNDDDAGPGASDDADGGTGDLDACIDKHAPRLPTCLRGLVTCVNDVGLFQRGASRSEIRGCVEEAHECIRERLAELRQSKRDRWQNRAGFDARDAGPPTGGSGGAEAGSGDGGSDAGLSPARDERRGRRHHDWKPFWRR